MAEIVEKIENLKDVIEKNKEKFSMQDCHNFVAYFNSIKDGIKGLDDKIKADNNRHVVIQEVIAKSHNASIEKIAELKESVEIIKTNTTKTDDETGTSKSDLDEVKLKCGDIEEKLISLEEKLNKNSESLELLQNMIKESYQGIIRVVDHSHKILVQHNAIIVMSVEKLHNGGKEPHTLETIQETSDEEKDSSDGEQPHKENEPEQEQVNDEEESHPNVTLEVSDK